MAKGTPDLRKVRDRDPQGSATFVSRELADSTVKMLARFGIISEVIEDGRWFRVEVHRRNA